MRKPTIVRLVIFLFAAGLHGILLFFLVFRVAATVEEPEPVVSVMKLTDLREAPPPPPPPPEKPPEIQQTTVEAVAETMIETDEVPPEVVAPAVPSQRAEPENFLPMHRVSVPPVFSEREILRALVYPSIARRAGIEGLAYLELFIDREGQIQRINILKEDPAGRGFGEAAVKAFQGQTCVPAQANGKAVAVRYRYPVRFKLRD
jgi:protein TonB